MGSLRKELENIIKIKFNNKKLLEQALTHKSYAFENEKTEWNERLEFLGDSILSAVVSSFLYKKHKEYDEGQLSKLKANLVSRAILAFWAKEIDLGKYLLFGKGEVFSGGRKRSSLLSNGMEALIGALYLDQGFNVVQGFIEERIKKVSFTPEDYKSNLQEIVQSSDKVVPQYRVVKEAGPDHRKIFEIEVFWKDKVMGLGSGKNKKEAEQRAAKDALSKMDKIKKNK